MSNINRQFKHKYQAEILLLRWHGQNSVPSSLFVIVKSSTPVIHLHDNYIFSKQNAKQTPDNYIFQLFLN